MKNPKPRIPKSKVSFALIGSLLVQRDGDKCHYCGVKVDTSHSQVRGGYRPQQACVDHVIPLSRGGTDDPTNLVVACYRCNLKKHAREQPYEEHASSQKAPTAYFMVVENMVDDLDLSPQAVRLYLHYKRVVGYDRERICYENTDTISKKCNMSWGMVSKSRKELEAAGLISIEIKKVNGVGNSVCHVTLIDIMPENVDKYRSEKQATLSQYEQVDPTLSQCETSNKPVSISYDIDTACAEAPQEKPSQARPKKNKEPKNPGGEALLTAFLEVSGVPLTSPNDWAKNRREANRLALKGVTPDDYRAAWSHEKRRGELALAWVGSVQARAVSLAAKHKPVSPDDDTEYLYS